MPSGEVRGQLPQPLGERRRGLRGVLHRVLSPPPKYQEPLWLRLSWPLGNSSSASSRKPSLINTHRGKSVSPWGERDREKTQVETQTLNETESALGWDHMAPQPSPRERQCVAWDAPQETLPRSAHCSVLRATTGWVWPRQRRLADKREKERQKSRGRDQRDGGRFQREAGRGAGMRWLQAPVSRALGLRDKAHRGTSQAEG